MQSLSRVRGRSDEHVGEREALTAPSTKARVTRAVAISRSAELGKDDATARNDAQFLAGLMHQVD